MNLKNLSNENLHLQTVRNEEKIRLSTAEQLWHLRENERRMLYAQMGYRDLKEYCVKELKLSEGSAWRRISAMRLLKELPDVESKILSGSLNLSQALLVKTHFKEVETTLDQKLELISKIENQSTQDTARILAENQPDDFAERIVVKEKPLKGHRLEVTLILDEKLQNEIEEIQALLSKKTSKLDLLKMLVSEKLVQLKKELQKSKNTKSHKSEHAPIQHVAQPLVVAHDGKSLKEQSRYISAQTRREIKIRDRNQCQLRDPTTGRQCSARFNLQNDHIVPFAKGGLNNSANLQKLCSNHNRLRAVQQFGNPLIKKYVHSLR